MLESQPFLHSRQQYRIVDAAPGQLEGGYVEVRDMVIRQPWLEGDGTIPVTLIGHTPLRQPAPRLGTASS
jgi:Transmembrane protein of unknown function (DUF3556)